VRVPTAGSGYTSPMTMTEQERQALQDNWNQAKDQVRAQFPDVTDDDLNQGQSSPDQLADTISQRTGQDRSSVEQSLKGIAQQFTT
jgi:uncharacterized protein YjbJ (UPF0337 family)